MSHEAAVREKARRVIQAGKLPNRRPDRTWGGPGAGSDCPVCSAPVRPDELEFEIEFTRNGNDPSVDRYHVHVGCFGAWQLECHNASVPQAAS